MTMQEVTAWLSGLPESVWAEVFHGRDLFADKISREDYWQLYDTTLKEAQALAEPCKGGKPEDMAETLGLQISPMVMRPGEAGIVFGLFIEPDRIEIQEEAAAHATLLLDEIDPEILQGTSVRDILIAHEIFHALQLAHPELTLHQKHVTTFRLGRFERKAVLGSLEEAAAMAFARHMLGLSFQPVMLDIYLCFERFPERSRELLQYIQNVRKEME